jgi:NTP pyrophosphatase (non-canonical NTP hydrolase)
MNLKNEFDPIRKWASEKGIYDKGDIKTQYIKLLEEVGELSRAILDKDKAEFIDAIGDCVVVLTNLAELGSIEFEDIDIDIENCINSAYGVIANRRGKMINGTFVKEI